MGRRPPTLYLAAPSNWESDSEAGTRRSLGKPTLNWYKKTILWIESIPSTWRAESKVWVQFSHPPVCFSSLEIILQHTIPLFVKAVDSYSILFNSYSIAILNFWKLFWTKLNWTELVAVCDMNNIYESRWTFKSFASSSSGLKRHLKNIITWKRNLSSPAILKCAETRTVKVGVGSSGFFHLE